MVNEKALEVFGMRLYSWREDAPEKCPKCDASKDKFVQLSDEDANKVYMSDRTNDIHMEIVNLAARIIALCEEGININLDPPCVEAFKEPGMKHGL